MRRLIEIVAVLIILLLIAYLVGCKDETEANETARPIYLNTKGASWIFEGTFCPKCNKLYNYIEHPEICDKCGTQTQDFYYLCLIKDR